MLDIRLIRENPELVRQSLEKRGDSFALDNILEIDERYRNLLRQTEELRAKHNETSKQLGKSTEKPPQLIAEMRQLGEQISSLQQQTREAKADLDSMMLELPNIPHPLVFVGRRWPPARTPGGLNGGTSLTRLNSTRLPTRRVLMKRWRNWLRMLRKYAGGWT